MNELIFVHKLKIAKICIAMMAILIAGGMAFMGISGWGWFIFAAVVIGG